MPAGAHGPPARALHRRPPPRAPTAAPRRCLATVGLLDVADRRVDGFSKGMRQRTQDRRRPRHDPQVLVLDEPLNGADPVQRVAAHRPVHAARRRGPHRHRQLARPARGRAAGRAGHRAGPRPARRRRRPPRHPRRHGRPPPPRARARDRRPPLAAALVGAGAVAGVTVDGPRDGLVVQTMQARRARRRAAADGPRP